MYTNVDCEQTEIRSDDASISMPPNSHLPEKVAGNLGIAVFVGESICPTNVEVTQGTTSVLSSRGDLLFPEQSHYGVDAGSPPSRPIDDRIIVLAQSV